MIVVDTNIIGYLFLSSEKSLLAERALKKDNEWAAPMIWRSEFRNILTFYVRKHIINLSQAQHMMNNALAILSGREYTVPSYDVLRLAATSQCPAYHCEFIAVANDLRVPLVTADKQLLSEFSAVAVSLDVFAK